MVYFEAAQYEYPKSKVFMNTTNLILLGGFRNELFKIEFKIKIKNLGSNMAEPFFFKYF